MQLKDCRVGMRVRTYICIAMEKKEVRHVNNYTYNYIQIYVYKCKYTPADIDTLITRAAS